MKKFTLHATITVSTYTIVEAETLEDAKDIAEGRQADFKHLGNHIDENDTWVVDELDGEPKGIREVED